MMMGSTYMKANAFWVSEYFVEVQEEAGAYRKRLDAYEEEGLEELAWHTEQQRKKRTMQINRVSCTDSESRHMKCPGKPCGQHYLSYQAADTNCGMITALMVAPGDGYNSIPYLEQLEHIHKNVILIRAAAADFAYDFLLAHQVLEEQGICYFARSQPFHGQTKVKLKRDVFFYDEVQDI